MEILDQARKGRIMNIKEWFYIYAYKYYNRQIEEQRANEEFCKNILFDTALTYINMAP
jgi:hypothetical protein